MRITQIVDSLDLGGVERLAVSLALEQKRRGDEPHIYCIYKRGTLADEAESAGITVNSFDKTAGPSPRTLFRMVRALMADRVDVVHTHNPGIHHYGAVAATLARVPVVVNTRHSLFSSQGVRYQERNFRRVMRWTDEVVFVSDDVRRETVNRGDFPVANSVIPCAIPIQQYKRHPASPGSALPRVRFGTLGRMVPAKAHGVLLEAFSQVLKIIPSAELRIAGGGQLRGDLQQHAVRLGIAHKVSIEEAAESAGFLENLDVFVLSSRSEGLPLVLLEAMAAGVPVVSTRVGGIPHVLSEDIGWLCPAENQRALAESMVAASGSSDVLVRVARGSALVTQRYGIDCISQQYRTLFERLFASKPDYRH